MKKRAAAIILGITLCVTSVFQTGAAVFDDQETAAETVFSDVFDVVETEGETSAVTNEEQPVTENVQEEEDSEISDVETPEQDVFSEVEETETIPASTPQASVEEPADEEVFDAGEDSDSLAEPEELVVEEILTAADGKIYAANWKKVNGKWKLQKPSMLTTSGEETEDLLNASEVQYYTAEDGIVHIQTYQSVGKPNTLLTEGDYYFDADGYLVTGRYKVPAGTENSPYTTAKEFYFMDETNAVLKNTNSSAACTPLNSNLGQMQKKYWLWTGSIFRYYTSNGGFLSVTDLDNLAKEKGTYTGYYKINGSVYFLKSSGAPRVGHVTVTEGNKPGKYYAQPAENDEDIPGKMYSSGWLRLKDSKGVYYWEKYGKDGRYLNQGIVATKLDKTIDPSIGNYTYLLNAKGYILKSKMVKAADGYYYCSSKYGRIYRSKLVTYQNARYYFGANGRRVTWTNSWHRIESSGNRYYYFGSTPGKVKEKTGWQRVIKTNGSSAGWFYFSKNGNHYVDKLTSAGRYFRTDGRLASGITTVNGKTYFFQGSTATEYKGVMYKSTWIHYQSKWYYAGSNGVLYKSGWKYINGGYYYFNSDYTVKTDAVVTRNGVKGYVDSKGKFYSAGWVIISNARNQVKYVDPDTGRFVVNTSKVINGLKYYFDEDGYRINDLTSMYKGPYYLEVDRVNGVMTVYDSTKTVPVKTIRVSVGLSSTPTWPTNKTMTLTRADRWQALMGPSWGQYGTHVDGAGNGGIYIHSVAGASKSYYSLPAAAYNQLGNAASHGCIRCCVADARWVYYNCNGSTIRIVDGTYNANEAMKGPLGRKALVPLYGSMNFDPTDNLAWH